MRLPWIVFGAMAATVAVGLALDASGHLLGVPHPPFIGAWGPRANVLILVAIPCFAGAVALVPTLLRARPAVLAVALYVITLVLRVALATGRGGTGQLDRALFVGERGEGKNEYLPSLAAFDYGPRFFVDRFAELVPSLPVHSRRAPAGPAADDALPRPRHGAAAGRVLHPRRRRQRAADLRPRAPHPRGERTPGSPACSPTFAPALLHFGATSADAVFLTLGPAGRDRTRVPPLARRTRSRRRLAVRLVAARRRRLGRAPGPAARRLQARIQARGDLRRGAARLPRRASRSRPASTRSARSTPPRASTRSASRRGGRTPTGCSAPRPRSCSSSARRSPGSR